MLVAALVFGAVANVAVRAGLATTAGVLAVVVAAAVTWRTSDRSASQRALLVMTLVVAPWFMLRSSDWLFALNSTFVFVLITTGAVLARSGRLSDVSIPRLLTQWPRWLAFASTAPVFLGRTLRHGLPFQEHRARLHSASRGLLIMVPTVVILGALLAAGDAVFAQLLSDLPSAGPISGHLLASMALAVPMGGVLAVSAQTTPVAPMPDQRRPLGSAEALVVLSGLVALYGAFTVVQVATALGGAEAVLADAGLTRAQHARQGFFSLLWAAALTLVVLLTLQLTTRLDDHRNRRWFRGLALAAILLTEVIVAGAVHRLLSYAEVFGWTVLRLASTGLALWIGVVFLLLGIDILGPRDGRGWFPVGVLAVSFTLIVAANVVDHERFIVNHNIDHASAEVPLDIAYLQSLSADGRAQVIRRFEDLSPDHQQAVAQDCRSTLGGRQANQGVASNSSEARYDRELAKLCGS